MDPGWGDAGTEPSAIAEIDVQTGQRLRVASIFKAADLAHHEIASYSLLSMGETWGFDGPDGHVIAPVSPRLRCNSGDTCRAVALAHCGIILQPSFLVGEDIHAGTLVELMPEFRSISLDVFAVYPSRKFVSPKVRLLIDFLINALREAPWQGD